MVSGYIFNIYIRIHHGCFSKEASLVSPWGAYPLMFLFYFTLSNILKGLWQRLMHLRQFGLSPNLTIFIITSLVMGFQ